MKTVLSFIERNLEQIISGICLCTIACCVMLQIILRYAFSAAAPWAEELSVYAMVGVAYFGASLAIRDCAHIRISIFYDLLPSKLRIITIIIADLLWLLFLFLVLSQSIILIKFLFQTVHTSPGLGIEQKWPQSIVPLCVALMIVRIIQGYWRWFKDGKKGIPI